MNAKLVQDFSTSSRFENSVGLLNGMLFRIKKCVNKFQREISRKKI